MSLKAFSKGVMSLFAHRIWDEALLTLPFGVKRQYWYRERSAFAETTCSSVQIAKCPGKITVLFRIVAISVDEAHCVSKW